jgi:hypothetical protein
MPLQPRIRPCTNPPLSLARILAWSDEFHRQYDSWPNQYDDLVPGELTQTWTAVDIPLRNGLRGLPAGPGDPAAPPLSAVRGSERLGGLLKSYSRAAD